MTNSELFWTCALVAAGALLYIICDKIINRR